MSLKITLCCLGFVVFAFVAAFPASAQVAGPIAPPPTYKLKEIPAKPNPGAPPLPANVIIERFTQNEDLAKKAFDADSFDQTYKIEELADKGGQFLFQGSMYTKADGKRYERVIKPPDSTLHYTEFSLDDVKSVASLPFFFLTTSQLPDYDLSYEGQEKLDEINTFIFRVKPKHLTGAPLFDGVVWVDEVDFAIVKSYGQFVTEAGSVPPQFPFTMFETYRENLVGKLWFPTYIRSDGDVKTPSGNVTIRLIVRSTNFKPNSPPAEPSATPKPSSPGEASIAKSQL